MTVISSGSLTPTDATEEQFTGADVTTTGSLLLYLDFDAAALGDVIIFRGKRNILLAGTIQTFFTGVYEIVGGDNGVTCIPFNNEFDTSFTVEYETGTVSAIVFSIETP